MNRLLLSILLPLSLLAISEPQCIPAYTVHKEHFTAQYFSPLPDVVIERIKGKSWKEDCPIPLDDLAYVVVTHWNLNNELVQGELIWHKNLATEIVDIFYELYHAQYPIEKMALIDDYDADDELSMTDNNSSAFCSRPIIGKTDTFSQHSYGGTIDINPRLNPYVKGNTVLPRNATRYVNRTQDQPGLIKEGDACYTAFVDRGYTWGGHWKTLKDYQHFEKDPNLFIP